MSRVVWVSWNARQRSAESVVAASVTHNYCVFDDERNLLKIITERLRSLVEGVMILPWIISLFAMHIRDFHVHINLMILFPLLQHRNTGVSWERRADPHLTLSPRSLCTPGCCRPACRCRASRTARSRTVSARSHRRCCRAAAASSWSWCRPCDSPPLRFCPVRKQGELLEELISNLDIGDTCDDVLFSVKISILKEV